MMLCHLRELVGGAALLVCPNASSSVEQSGLLLGCAAGVPWSPAAEFVQVAARPRIAVESARARHDIHPPRSARLAQQRAAPATKTPRTALLQVSLLSPLPPTFFLTCAAKCCSATNTLRTALYRCRLPPGCPTGYVSGLH